jgi:hypothetical protein
MLLSRLALDRGRALRMLVFLGNFTLAKAAIYLIPLGIAAVAPGETYGAIELAQSIGLLAVALTIGAPLSGFTQQYLVRKDRSGGAAIALASFAGCLSGLAAFLVAVLLGAAPGGAARARLAGGGSDPQSHQHLLPHLQLAQFHRLGRRVRDAHRRRGGGRARAGRRGLGRKRRARLCLGRAARLPRHRLVAVARGPDAARRAAGDAHARRPADDRGRGAGDMAGRGGRIVVGFLNASALPEFGVAFRVAGLALGIHQLLTTALFARVYAARTRQADKVLAWFFLAVALLLIAIAVVGRWLPDFVTFSALDAGSAQAYRTILPLPRCRSSSGSAMR